MKDPAVSLHMNLEIILYLGAGVLCAFLPLRFQYLMLFPFLTYGYLHNRRALLFFLFSHVLFLGALSVSTAYLTLLGILIFFLLVQCVRSTHRLSLWLTLINIAMQFPFVIQMQDAAQIISMMLLLIVLYGEQYEKDAWIRNEWWDNDVWKGTLIVSLYLFFGILFPKQELLIATAASLAAALFCSPASAAVLFLMMRTCEPHFPLLSAIGLLVFHAKEIRMEGRMLLYLVIVILQHPDWQELAAAVACLLVFLTAHLYVQRKKPLVHPMQGQDEKQQLRRRLQNFSGIFHSMAQFYRQHAHEDAALLFQMAEGVEQMSRELFDDREQLDEKQLREILEGYQFDVYSLNIAHLAEGDVQIEGVVGRISGKEMEGTLMPLLSTLYHCSFRLTHMEDSRWLCRSTRFVVSSAPVLKVEGACESIAAGCGENGDTCSLFRYGACTLCTISDGMGNGAMAAESSSLVSGIFQRMIVSGMELSRAVRTINQLVHSDTYATLDAICIDAHKGSAYLVKSAACPTLLLRGSKLIRLSGRSLPIGIVEEIQPDCLRLQLQEGDEIIMFSDGVHPQEILEWTREKDETQDVRGELSVLMRKLKSRERSDDSTVAILKVERYEV